MAVRVFVPPRRTTADRTVSTPAHTLGIRATDSVKLVRALQAGLPYSAIRRLEKRTGLSLDEIAAVIQIPRRTLARRKVQKEFTPHESERLYRLADVVECAIELFEGDVRLTRNWLRAPRRALGGKTPLEMTETELGAQQVRDLIGRLEYGVLP
jgi:putative toxin-antitoxin system antitoxin component (TIGR02293 family)